MQPPAVVEDLDVLEHGVADLGSGGPRASVDAVLFERGEPAFGYRVVKAVADGAHRGVDAAGPQGPAESEGGVWASLVGVMDHAGCRASGGDGHLEGLDDQFGSEV